LSLAAEIQHRLLPGSYTCEAGQFTLAAWLEPAGNVGGDTFDFALERDTLHLGRHHERRVAAVREKWPTSRSEVPSP
jgi:hypothetical protein